MALVKALLVLLLAAAAGPQTDYTALWDKATPFDQYLAGVRARQEAWKSRFANAAVDADLMNEVRALPAKRRILAVAEDRCSDSAWAVPYIAKLAAAVPERLEVRVIGRKDGSGIQSDNLTPDGRLATPTVLVLDEMNRPLGAWVERPSELQKWFIDNKATLDSDVLHEKMDAWYTADAGKSTLREVLALLKKGKRGL
jgi:hypothetical protein